MDHEVFTEGMGVLRIYMAEKDHFEGVPFYEWVVQRACACGMAGATVMRGIGGYCLGNPVLAPQFSHFQINQPVVVEIIDRMEDIEDFVKKIGKTIPRGLMTVQPVGIRYYGDRKKEKP